METIDNDLETMTPEEIIYFMIGTEIQDINTNKQVIQWVDFYSETCCDQLIAGIYQRNSTETNTMHERERDAWHYMPESIRTNVLSHLHAKLDSRLFIGETMPMKYVVKKAKELINYKKQIIQVLRKGRDNGDFYLLYTASQDVEKWKLFTITEQSIVRCFFIDLCKITIPMNQSIFFCKKILS